ncbi:MAG: N-acetylmuramoyl-L-alanine amidase, partial [Krumholzibacteria bacterium]|nr:N-acetylmuramoyl-L-alanine amidase [Candidatus Krumholzibacteria bacterium]
LALPAAARPAPATAAVGPVVLGIRHSSTPERTRVVLDLDRSASFEVRQVGEPYRLAVNLPGGSFGRAAALRVGDGLVRSVRCNAGASRAQVVLDLEQEADFRSFSLPAADGRPDRIVIDVLRGAPAAAGDRPAVAAAAALPALRPFTVVLDPGHGGDDPGAIRDGLREKDVVLDVALEAARLIDALPGYRAVLTRRDDSYPSLARRVGIAAEADGDVFLSIHCNTHRRSEVAGMEVYFLSLQGATDREAQELANQENARQLVGLDAGGDHDEQVVGILLDLRTSRVLHESSRLADQLLAAAASGDVVAARKVKQARFQVLSQLAMPAALVELAYLSNPGDLALLRDGTARGRLAAVVVEGLVQWRRDRDAAERLAGIRSDAWSRQYSVRRGDSLWSLARRHGTTVAAISRHNDLAGAGLAVGQVLQLPPTGREP